MKGEHLPGKINSNAHNTEHLRGQDDTHRKASGERCGLEGMTGEEEAGKNMGGG